MNDITIDPQYDGRIFVKRRGLVIFISRSKTEIDNFVRICFPKLIDPDANKNDWTEEPGPYWR